MVEEGDTDTAPFGMGTYASRSTPVAGAAVAMVSRKVRAKARKLAAHLLEVSEEDVEWELGRFYVRSAPDRGVTIQECAMAAYSNMPDGMEPGLEGNAYYDPPNLTWPFACYIATVEVDPQTGVWDVLNMVAVDDCGVRINPMIVEGQIMGGLTEAYAMASMQFITFDAEGNCVGSNYMDYLLPTAWETPGYELHEVVTPCPHHPIGAKGVGECATVGGPAAFVNAVMDALKGTGVRNIDMPLLPDRVYEALTQRHDVSGAPAGEAGRLRDEQPRQWTAGTSCDRAGELARRARSSRWQRWCGGRGRRPASRVRGRSSRPSGELFGWIGGACAEPVVIREAQRAIAEREPRLLLLGTPEQFGHADAGRHAGHPHLLPERGRLGGLHRAGHPHAAPGRRRPVADGATPWSTSAARSAGGPTWSTAPDFTAADADARSIVVVATQGHGDEEAVEQAALGRPAYVGLVASRKRGRVGARLPGRP